MKLAPYIPVTTGSLTPENQVFISALDQCGKIVFLIQSSQQKKP